MARRRSDRRKLGLGMLPPRARRWRAVLRIVGACATTVALSRDIDIDEIQALPGEHLAETRDARFDELSGVRVLNRDRDGRDIVAQLDVYIDRPELGRVQLDACPLLTAIG